MQTHPS